ncbi:hypothetical protein ES705_07340 [subsurface metagenome]
MRMIFILIFFIIIFIIDICINRKKKKLINIREKLILWKNFKNPLIFWEDIQNRIKEIQINIFWINFS